MSRKYIQHLQIERTHYVNTTSDIKTMRIYSTLQLEHKFGFNTSIKVVIIRVLSIQNSNSYFKVFENLGNTDRNN